PLDPVHDEWVTGGLGSDVVWEPLPAYGSVEYGGVWTGVAGEACVAGEALVVVLTCAFAFVADRSSPGSAPAVIRPASSANTTTNAHSDVMPIRCQVMA
ncbi:MAG: hypothetical protein QOI65_193, partial [Thermoleophilaceae bacterium]|nr:hypothetical protein [Thermoleophilaceae bacterium]